MLLVNIIRITNLLAYICGLSYATWNIFLTAKDLLPLQSDPFLYRGPLTWLTNRGRDTSDCQWIMIIQELPSQLVFLLVYTIASAFAYSKNCTVLQKQIFSSVWTLFYMYYKMHLSILVYLVCHPVVFWLSGRLIKSKMVIALLTVGSMYSFTREHVLVSLVDSEETGFHFGTITAWLVVRCASFCLETLNTTGDKKEVGSSKVDWTELVTMVNYVFYFPTVLYGPLILYDVYKQAMTNQGPMPISSRTEFGKATQLVKKCIRLCLCVGFTELVIHFLYFRPLAEMEYRTMRKFNWWTLCGVTYWITQFFQMKTGVQFGIGYALAEYDGIKIDPLPICPGYVHRYASCWKYFDIGLYRFSAKYIYIPTLERLKSVRTLGFVWPGEIRKLVGTALVSLFIFMWHGFSLHMLIWTGLNFTEAAFESLGAMVKRLVDRRIKFHPLVWDMVIEPLATAPLTLMSLLINALFIVNSRVAWNLCRRIVLNDDVVYIYMFYWSAAQVGVTFRAVPQLSRWTTAYRHRYSRNTQ